MDKHERDNNTEVSHSCHNREIPLDKCHPQMKENNQIAATSSNARKVTSKPERDGESKHTESGTDESESAAASGSDSSSPSDNEDPNAPENGCKAGGWVANLPSAGPQDHASGVSMPNNEATIFGEVNVKSSENVHLGSRTLYKGPVTINQYLYSHSPPVTGNNGNVNAGGNEEDRDHKRTKEKSTESSDSMHGWLNSMSIFLRYKVSDWLKGKRYTVIICVSVVIVILITILSIALLKGSNSNSLIPPKVITPSPAAVPYSPASPLNVTQVADNTVAIEWGMPEYDGGAPLEMFKIDVKNTSEETWLEVGQVNANIQNLTVKNLLENREYLFRVYAKNRVGFSAPLESEEPFKISPPPVENLKIVSREEWNAKPGSLPPVKLEKLPAPYVIICSTRVGHCFDKDTCINQVHSFQEAALRQGRGDIEYNFLIGGDGLVYEGRGWDIQGNHTTSYNNRSIGVGFIGDYWNNSPTDKQLDSTKKLLEYGLENKGLASDYKLLGQSEVSSNSESPGYELLIIIRTWKHWSSNP